MLSGRTMRTSASQRSFFLFFRSVVPSGGARRAYGHLHACTAFHIPSTFRCTMSLQEAGWSQTEAEGGDEPVDDTGRRRRNLHARAEDVRQAATHWMSQFWRPLRWLPTTSEPSWASDVMARIPRAAVLKLPQGWGQRPSTGRLRGTLKGWYWPIPLRTIGFVATRWRGSEMSFWAPDSPRN